MGDPEGPGSYGDIGGERVIHGTARCRVPSPEARHTPTIARTEASDRTPGAEGRSDGAGAGTGGSIEAAEKRRRGAADRGQSRSEEHTSELQSRFGISYAVFC